MNKLEMAFQPKRYHIPHLNDWIRIWFSGPMGLTVCVDQGKFSTRSCWQKQVRWSLPEMDLWGSAKGDGWSWGWMCCMHHVVFKGLVAWTGKPNQTGPIATDCNWTISCGCSLWASGWVASCRTFKIFENCLKTSCNRLQPVFLFTYQTRIYWFILFTHSFFNTTDPPSLQTWVNYYFFKLRSNSHQIIATTQPSLWLHLQRRPSPLTTNDRPMKAYSIQWRPTQAHSTQRRGWDGTNSR